MLRENASTTRFVLDAQLLAIRTIQLHALRHPSVLTAERIVHYTIKSAVLQTEYDIQSIRVSNNVSVFETRKVDKQTHVQRVNELCWSLWFLKFGSFAYPGSLG